MDQAFSTLRSSKRSLKYGTSTWRKKGPLVTIRYYKSDVCSSLSPLHGPFPCLFQSLATHWAKSCCSYKTFSKIEVRNFTIFLFLFNLYFALENYLIIYMANRTFNTESLLKKALRGKIYCFSSNGLNLGCLSLERDIGKGCLNI